MNSLKLSSKGLLEKKWTSILKLQKRVMELEATVEQMKKASRMIPGQQSSVANVNGNGGELTGQVTENSTAVALSLIQPQKLFPKG